VREKMGLRQKLRPIATLANELPWLPPSLYYYWTGGWPRIHLHEDEAWKKVQRQPNILLIPGFIEGSNISRRAHDMLEQAGIRVFVPGIYRFGLLNFGDINQYNAKVEERLARLVDEWGRFILVGYSKGGLTCIHLLKKFDKYVDKIFLISTPVQGCELADLFGPWLPLPAAKQMQTNSPFLKETLAGLTEEMQKKIVVFSCLKDGVVWPERTILPGAQHVNMNVSHLQAYVDERVFTQIAMMVHSI